MISTWKVIGRTLEIITIVLLVLAVSYLLVNSGSVDTEAPQVASQAPDTETKTVERSYQPPEQSSAATGNYRQLQETPLSIDVSPPVDLYQQPYQTGPEANSTIAARSCDSPRTLSNPLPRAAGTGQFILKIATVMPERSKWMKDMRAGAAEIKERTEGRVLIKYFGGGIMGNDKKVLGQIRIGRLQGGAFTPSALQPIYPDISIYGLPLLFQSEDEALYVRRQLDQRLLHGLKEAGFVSFGFAATGFAVIMSNDPVQNLGNMKGKRVWVPEGDTVSYASMEALSLSPVTLPLTDVLAGLQTGLIDIVSMTPIGTWVLQWYVQLKFVTDMPLFYTMSFMAIDIKAFNRIDTADQEVLTEVMTRVYCNLDKANLIDNEEAYEALLNSGIQGVMVKDDEIERIREIVDASNRRLAEQGFFSMTLFEDLLGHVEDYRGQSR